MLKLIVVVATLVGSVACGGSAIPHGDVEDGRPPQSAAQPPPPPREFAIAGYTIGEPSAQVEARVPEATSWDEAEGSRRAKVNVTWRDRPWLLALEVRDDVLHSITIQSTLDDDPIDDVRAWAGVMCNEVGPDATRMVGWAAPPNERYLVPLDKALEDGTTLGCVVDRTDKFVFAGAARDAIIALVSRGLDPKSEARFAGILPLFVPFDWTKEVHVGDPIDLGGYRYTIDSIVPTDRVGKNRYLRKSATEGATFLVVRYRIENTGNETAAVIASDLVVRDAKSRIFRRSSDGTTALAAEEDVDLILAELQPGIPRKQIAVFELPNPEMRRLDLVIPEKGLLGSDEVVIPLTFFEPE